MPSYFLVETAMGYALFQIKASEEVASNLSKVQKNLLDYKYVSDMASLTSFIPFETPEHGLENMNSISEGVLHEFLANFLSTNITDKKSRLGIHDKNLAGAVSEATGIKCYSNESVLELSRAVRLHMHKFLEGVKQSDVEKAQLGLGHAYSRAKVKFNVNKADNMIIQTIAMVDQLDKDLNTFAMRLREWYAWHFPELTKIVKDNVTYAKLVKLLRDKSNITNDMLHAITEVTADEKLAEDVLVAAKSSMGLDVSEYDMLNIEQFANKVISLYEYRKQLYEYLQSKMHTVAPNLTVLLGEQVAARLIAHSGSVVNLSKCPASTIQILGAEKALFRALKTKSKTPKYGLIYHSTFIGKASKQNKGKISRYLANKCSIAVRMDAFSDFPTTVFGEKLKKQVEDRLTYYEAGGKKTALKKNVDVMREAMAEAQKDAPVVEATPSKKRKNLEKDAQDEAEAEATPSKKQKKDKKDKKEKKDKKKKKDEDAEEEQEESLVAETPSKKSKKEKKSEETVEETPSKKDKKDKKKKKEASEDMDVAEDEEKESKKSKKDKKEKKDKKKKKSEDSDSDE